MKDSGIGGATIFNLTSCARLRNDGPPPTEDAPVSPWPDITYRSPKYWEMVEFAASEAKRLGLEIGMHNCVGYSGHGGPVGDGGQIDAEGRLDPDARGGTHGISRHFGQAENV